MSQFENAFGLMSEDSQFENRFRAILTTKCNYKGFNEKLKHKFRV